MNADRTKVMPKLQPFPVQITEHPKNTKYFIYLDSITTNDTRCTAEIKTRIAMAKKKTAFNRKRPNLTFMGPCIAMYFYIKTE